MKKLLTTSTLFLLCITIIFGQTTLKSTPEKAGISSDSLKVAAQKMQEYIDKGKLAGISTLVMKDGKIVQRENFGYADLNSKKPIEDNTIFRIFSMTKPITAAALMILYDEGKFKLDDKVSKYIPEFKGAKVYYPDGGKRKLKRQKQKLTIRHLLTHTSGIPYGWDRKAYVDSLYRAIGRENPRTSIGNSVKTLAGLPLKNQPGTKWEYGLSTDVAGYLVEVLSGMPLDEYFKTKVFNPLNMHDTGFYVPEEKHGRFAALNRFDKEGKLLSVDPSRGGFLKATTYFSGGGGLVSTMDDYLSFCQMLLNGGELNGKRILEASTAKLIMTDQLPPKVKYEDGFGYGLAGQVHLESGEYSWAGAASTNFWIDPGNEMIIITMTQLMPSDYSYANVFKDIIKRGILK